MTTADRRGGSVATARRWDDGIIDPRQTRQVVGLALATTLNAPIPDTGYGVLRI